MMDPNDPGKESFWPLEMHLERTSFVQKLCVVVNRLGNLLTLARYNLKPKDA